MAMFLRCSAPSCLCIALLVGYIVLRTIFLFIMTFLFFFPFLMWLLQIGLGASPGIPSLVKK